MSVRVVVVDDSSFARAALQETLEEERDIEVVATAADGEGVLDIVRKFRPDLVTMDIQMSGRDGLFAIEQLMAHAPVPILVVTSLPTGKDSTLLFEALRRGALDVATKPGRGGTDDGPALRRKVRSLAGVTVVRHVAGLRAKTSPPVAMPTPRTPPLVGIVSSAGGPIAVAQVLAALSSSFGGCIALVQHLPSGFAKFFVGFLQRHISLDIVIADNDITPRPGLVVVATDDRHLVLTEAGKLGPSTAPPEGGHRPSATVLLRSLARFAGARATGVVLTGIGDDGAAGLLELRRAGGTTIAQDSKTSVVFGMPRAAIALGAASQVLALDDIAPALVEGVLP